MKNQTMHAQYFFHHNHSTGARIAELVEKAFQHRYPTMQVSLVQDAYDLNSRPLYTFRVTSDRLTQPIIRDIRAFMDGAIAVATQVA